MYAKSNLFVAAATIACVLFAGSLPARDKIVTVAEHVSAQGLDLTRPADAKAFYRRLQHAARSVCSPDVRASLQPVDSFILCYEKALAEGVRGSNAPLIAQMYLFTHTPQQAAKYGIEMIEQLAAK